MDRCDRKTCDKEWCPDPVQRETQRSEIFSPKTSVEQVALFVFLAY